MKNKKIMLTPFERKICSNVFAAGYSYVARDVNLCAFRYEPRKVQNVWLRRDYDLCKEVTLDSIPIGNILTFISRDDEKPWELEDLLKLEIRKEEQ